MVSMVVVLTIAIGCKRVARSALLLHLDLTISWSSLQASGHRLRSIFLTRSGHSWRNDPEPAAAAEDLSRRSDEAAGRDRGTRAFIPTLILVDAMPEETRA
ncbi:jg26097 [Pararge aegeria aegeria]|uniref:Jg26097 protein n=1 Tax=Pararge aegeria aegeria TaxID=348720 RepID=A0A8S4QXN5_9NEOP|nr:jg26097 [Pararge aegeria aegeria]